MVAVTEEKTLLYKNVLPTTTTGTTTKLFLYLSLPKIENYAKHFHIVQKSQIQKTTSARHVRNLSQLGQSDKLSQATKVLFGTLQH